MSDHRGLFIFGGWGGMSVETRFFEPAQGGDPVMLQHLIWFFGHPEVYVLLLQAVVAIIALVVLGRRWRVLSSWRRAMGFFGAIALAIATLALWAARNQQQYSEGIAGTPIGEDWVMYPPLANAPPAQIASFGIDVWALMAVMCAVLVIFLVLAFTKPRRLWTPILFAGTGLAVLAAGAIGAILLQNQGIDRTLHDTYYVIAHMQFVVSIVAVFLAFAASYLFFSQVIGISYRAWLGVLHWALFTLGGVCVLLPQMWLSFGGMPRRYIDYDVELSRWNWGGELGLVLAGLSLAVFALCIIEAVIRRARSGKTPPSAPSDN